MGDSSAGGGSQQTAATATSIPPTATPIPEDSAVQSIEETGLVVDSLELDPGTAGGKVKAVVTNSADEPCNGAVVMVALLREDGTVAGEVGLRGQKVDPGESKELEDRYFGSTVAKAEVSSATCADSTLSDASAPDREQTAVPGN